MKVRRITDQPRPLEEHYARLANDPNTSDQYAELGRRMLELLLHWPAIDVPPVWAVTLHADLVLVATDDHAQRPLMVITGGGLGEAFSFAIECPGADGEGPWPGVQARLVTHNVLQACEMIAHGLSKATGSHTRFVTRPNQTLHLAGSDCRLL